MSDASDRYGLPFILPGQAQKEWFHNEALARIDAALHSAVEGGPEPAPPADPSPGQCWLIAAGATGAWAGRAGQLAAWTQAGWRYIAPQIGMLAWDKRGNFFRRWTGMEWTSGEIEGSSLVVSGNQVVGPRLPSLPSPSGGTIIDVEGRLSIEAIIVALRTHGLID